MSLQLGGNKVARGLLATDHVILNHGQVTWTTPELASPSPNYHTSRRTFQLSTDLTCHRVRRRNVHFDYEARGDPIDDPTLKYKAEFYFFTIERERDKAINALESRLDLISTHSNYFQFLYNICDLKYTPQNDELKYCKDLETVLTDGNSPDINALDLAHEIVAVLALLNKKESPIEVLKFRSNLDFAPNLGTVLRILLTLPTNHVEWLFMELDETAKARYDEKLSCNGNKLPDPFDQSTMEHCSFRLGEVCSHVAAFLFAVEMANNESPAPTSVACMWNKTSKKVDPVQFSAINFSRKRKCKQKVFKKSKLPSEEAYKTFLEAIKEHNLDAPYLEDLTDEEEASSANETEHQEENHLPNLIELLRTKFSGMLKHVRADDSIHSMLLDCSLSHETIQNIEFSTRDQASSAMWNHQRKGRVTSSLFGKILRCKTGQKGLVN
ncbi:uncharacterized protein TNCV_363261 [Trichonephila clavipes]|nr:uncharacterized protein TNCV_363261 [Trichonephila clavipes]